MKLIEKRVCEKFASRNRERPGGGTRKGGMVLVWSRVGCQAAVKIHTPGNKRVIE